MPHVEKHAPGSFCWIELGTTNQNAAKQFYTSLFGWTVNDFPMGPAEFYSMFQLDGRDVAAAYTLKPDIPAPPHWMIYIASENADDTSDRAAKAGAKVIHPPFDVMDVGRMCVIQDPTGAVFAVWQPKSHKGIGIQGDPGSLCWADLNTPDPARATKFYSDVFGWKLEPGESGYLHIRNGEEFIGGIPPAGPPNPQAPPHWLAYFAVSNCEESAAKAEQLGAGFYIRPIRTEKVGTFAVLKDPQRAAFALFTAL